MAAPRDLARKMAEKSDQDLLAMFASPEDWTTEALDCAKVELRMRGLALNGAGSQLEPEAEAAVKMDFNNRTDVYEYFGTYSNEDARLLLDAFISGDVDYTLNSDKMGMANMSPLQAANGGTFGTGVGIAIAVHADDCDKAMEIRQRVLKILL